VIAYLLQQDPGAVKNFVENPAKPAPIDKWGQLERLASTFDHVDGLFYFTYAVCIFCFVLITGVLFYSVVKYRRKTFDQPAASNSTHNTPLEVVWTVIPLIIVMVMFAWGWMGSLDMMVVPAEARQYHATARQWNWNFKYPNDAVSSDNELWLEVDKPAGFTLQSADVLHAFFIPAMRVKRDIIPGRLQTLWFTPTQLGEFHLFCAEYCGQDHSKMYSKVHVVSADTYKTRPWDQDDPKDPVATGERIYKSLCVSCHTVNGQPLTGPSWLGLFKKDESGNIVGAQREVFVGTEKRTVTVDDAYIVESIRKSDVMKAAGFEKNSMTPFPDMSDLKISRILSYMKSLAK